LDYLNQAVRLDSRLARRIDRLTQAILQAQNQTIPAQPGSEPAEISPAYLFLSSGRALAALDEWLLATYAFKQATDSQPEYAEAWAYLGEARTHITTDDQAQQKGLADIQHALQIDPASLPAHLFLAYYWTRQQDYDQAIQVIATTQAIYPQNPLLLAEMGNVLALSGDVRAAQEAYAQAIALAPDDPAYLRYAIRFSLTYNFEFEQLALPLARQAVILAPNDSETLDLMAQVLIRQGDLSNAERFVQRALQSQPDYTRAHLSLGIIYLMRNELDLARQELQIVLELAPGSSSAEPAQRLLETYFSS
jgi:tetratricopeptide (TPR) repeat protein